jgi:acetolactate synthase small subunit
MVKMTARKGKGDSEQLNKHISMLEKTLEEKDKHYERELMKIKRELEDAAKIGQQQIDELINIINCKTAEINRLNSRLKDNRIEVETLPSHQNLDSHLHHLESPRQEKPENYVERYAHFAK